MANMKRAIKRLCCAMIWVMAIQLSHADDQLRCSKDMAKIKKIYAVQKDIFDHQQFEDLQNHLNQYDYTRLFQKNHLNQTYYLDAWIPSDQATKDLKSAFDDKMETTYAVNQPFANFILNDQELCLITLDISFTSDEVTTTLKNLTDIWVRKTDSDHWYFFEYHEAISPEDFQEFFPDFPENIIFPMTETDMTTLEN